MKQPTDDQIKTLTINNKMYAKYLCEDGLLYLKTMEKIIPEDEPRGEEFLCYLIGLIERKNFKGLAYLNV